MSKHLPYTRAEMPDVIYKGIKIDGRLAKGLELFNQKDYYDCHEVIEDLWLETDPNNPHRDFYKGIIQAAAAIYQFDRGILTGALGLFKTCVVYLDKYKPEMMGLNVQKLIDEMNICFKELSTASRGLNVSRRSTPILEIAWENR